VVSEDEYRVPSSKDDGKMYDVNCCVGVCSCLAGRGGAFCKHQVLVFEKFGRGFPNLPAITFQERHQLGFLALGDRNHEPEFYIGLKETVTPQQVQIDEKYKTSGCGLKLYHSLIVVHVQTISSKLDTCQIES